MWCPSLNELPLPPSEKTGWPWTEESANMPDIMPDGSVWPKVTIVTPSYNQCGFVEETIRSILLQGYPNLEYIIIDGGSTDNSVEIIKKYGQWLAHWESKPDRGQSHAINKGWKRAAGDIIAYLNSDDTYEPGTLRIVAQYFAHHHEVDMVYGDCFQTDEHSKRLGPFFYKGFDPNKMLEDETWYIPQQAVFIKKAILLKVGFLDESLHYKMDRDLFIRIGMQGIVKNIPVYLASFRTHPEAKSTPGNVHKALKEFLRIRQKNGKPFSCYVYIRLYLRLAKQILLVVPLMKFSLVRSVVNLILTRNG